MQIFGLLSFLLQPTNLHFAFFTLHFIGTKRATKSRVYREYVDTIPLVSQFYCTQKNVRLNRDYLDIVSRLFRWILLTYYIYISFLLNPYSNNIPVEMLITLAILYQSVIYNVDNFLLIVNCCRNFKVMNIFPEVFNNN